MTDEIRVSAISFGTYYCACIHRLGQPDEMLDGADGKPLRFASMSEALRAGRGIVLPSASTLLAASRSYRTERNRDFIDERDRVFAKLGGASFKRGRR